MAALVGVLALVIVASGCKTTGSAPSSGDAVGGVAGGDVPVRTMLCAPETNSVVVTLDGPAPSGSQQVRIVAGAATTTAWIPAGDDRTGSIALGSWPPTYAVAIGKNGAEVGARVFGCAGGSAADSAASPRGFAAPGSAGPGSSGGGAGGPKAVKPSGPGTLPEGGDVPVRTLLCTTSTLTVILDAPNAQEPQRVLITYMPSGTKQTIQVPRGQVSVQVPRTSPGEASAVSIGQSGKPIGSPQPCASVSSQSGPPTRP